MIKMLYESGGAFTEKKIQQKMSEEKKWDFCGRVTEKQQLTEELVEREDTKDLIAIETAIQRQRDCRRHQGKSDGASSKRHRTTGRLFARESSG